MHGRVGTIVGSVRGAMIGMAVMAFAASSALADGRIDSQGKVDIACEATPEEPRFFIVAGVRVAETRFRHLCNTRHRLLVHMDVPSSQRPEFYAVFLDNRLADIGRRITFSLFGEGLLDRTRTLRIVSRRASFDDLRQVVASIQFRFVPF